MLLDILFVVAVIGVLIAIYKTKFSQAKTPQQLKAQLLRQTALSKKQTQKQQRMQQKHQAPTEWTGQQQENSQSQQQISDAEQNNSGGGNARLQMYKQQKRRQKQHRKQSQQNSLQQQKQKREQYQKKIQERERQQEQKLKKQQEYIEQMRQQQRKRKEEEFDKWKDMFSVQDSGVTQQSEDVVKRKQQELQDNLRGYLIKRKLTLLEDVSHKFSLTTKDLVQKIKKLQAQNRISGVFDQRGKYLYIEQGQWDAIKNYITVKGRLKKADMMTQCAKIVKIPELEDQDLVNLVNEVDQSSK